MGEAVPVSADVFRDGHDLLAARVRWRPAGERKWRDTPMVHAGNDRWEATVEPSSLGMHELVIEAWTDRFATWRHDVDIKRAAGQDVAVELEEGALLLERRSVQVPAADRRVLREMAARLRVVGVGAGTKSEAAWPEPATVDAVTEILAGVPDPVDLTRSRPLRLWVDRERALFASWYELFPRSEGGLAAAAAERLPAVAAMGFDVVYLPPVHPIGHSFRKGRNNTLEPGPRDPGSPWAIGNRDGGHTALEPSLGTMDDFDAFVDTAKGLGMEIALDYALQCSPDHPWVEEHPEWFHRRPDGTIHYAENPPKKYQDIYPINFWPEPDSARRQLWDECKGIVDFWIGHGVRIFRVDNPHTKPFAFWEWLIAEVQADHPDTIFLSEAFTRPKVMAKLAEVGFSQSYTYFTWRTAKWELTEYLEELCHGPKADFMRPNFWTNTQDILSGPLRNGSPAAFRMRLLLAATLVPSYGIYSGFELCENVPASDANEEYLDSEKYEIKRRDWKRAAAEGTTLEPLVTCLNAVRKRHPAFSELRNIAFHSSANDQVLCYSKRSSDGGDVVLVVVNLDPTRPQEDTLQLDLTALGIADATIAYEAHDELTGVTYSWTGASPYVYLDPGRQPGHVLHIRPA